MSITLDLQPEVEEKLQDNAARAGLSVDDYLLALMERDPVEEEPIPTTPAEILKHWDRVDARPLFLDQPEDSPELVHKWREQEERDRHHRLFGAL